MGSRTPRTSLEMTSLIKNLLLTWRNQVTTYLERNSSRKTENLSSIVNKLLLQVMILWNILELDQATDPFLLQARQQHQQEHQPLKHCTCLMKAFHEAMIISATKSTEQETSNIMMRQLSRKNRDVWQVLSQELTMLNSDEWKMLIELPCFFFVTDGTRFSLKSVKREFRFVPLLMTLSMASRHDVSLDGYFLGNLLEHLIKETKRKSKGIFYTPLNIVQEMCERSLFHFLVSNISVHQSIRNQASDLKTLLNALTPDQLNVVFSRILEMKVLDPAVGSGHFLEMMMEQLLTVMTRAWKTLKLTSITRRSQRDDHQETRSREHHAHQLFKELLASQSEDEFKALYCAKILLPKTLHGSDLDPISVKITRFRVFFKLWSLMNSTSVDLMTSLSSLDCHVLCSNTLTDSRWHHAAHDIIIGNPPYGRSVLTINEKSSLTGNFSCLKVRNPKKRSFNTASLFIEKSLQLVKQGGIICLIVPQSITRVEEFECLRELILKNSIIKEIIDEESPFPSVTLEMVTLILQKRNPPQTSKEDWTNKQAITILSKRQFPRNSLPRRHQVNPRFFYQFKRFFLYLDDFFEELVNGKLLEVIQGDYGLDHRRVQKDLQPHPTEEHSIPFLHSGKAVKPFFLDETHFSWSRRYHGGRFERLYQTRCIVTTAISPRPRAALKPPGMIPGTNVSIQRVVSQPRLHPKTVVVILNSQLIGYFLHRYVLNCSRLTIYLHKYYTKMIPITVPQDQEVFINLHDYLVVLTFLSRHANKPRMTTTLRNHDLKHQDVTQMLNSYQTVFTESLVLETYLEEWLENEGIPLEMRSTLKRHLKPIPELNYCSWIDFKTDLTDESKMSKRLAIIKNVHEQLVEDEVTWRQATRLNKTLWKNFQYKPFQRT